MRLFAKLKLDKETFLKYYKNGVRYFLYNEITFDTKEFEEQKVEFYNCSQDRVESTWYTWRENEKIISEYLERLPKAFTFEKYDFTLAVKKALYWSNQKSGFIEFARTTKFTEHEVVVTTPLHNYNRWKIILKTIALKVCKRIKYISQFNINKSDTKKGKVGIFIKHDFQLQLYKHIVAETKENNSFIFFVIDAEVFNGLVSLGVEQNRIIFIKSYNNSIVSKFLKNKNLLKLNNEDWYIWNQLLLQGQEFETWINLGLRIVETGVSKFLMNEGENGIMGAVLGEIMAKNNIITYNTMNGMKSGQAQDYFINFDKWFVWDEQMKALLMKGGYLPESKFIVSGHLMEDEVSNYIYQNSLKSFVKEFIGKKVISLFSVYGNVEEKVETLELIKRIAINNDSEYFFLLRPHPMEDISELIEYESKNVKVVRYNKENSKKLLYDQISISDLSICFGSTVALESSWFGVPCISVEKREKSLIYAANNKFIFHKNFLTEEMLKQFLCKNKARLNTQKVASKIISYLYGF